MGKRGSQQISAEAVLNQSAGEIMVSQSAAARMVHPKHGFDQARKMLGKKLRGQVEQKTPYGDLLKKIEIITDTGTKTLQYVCPHAWLYHVCSASIVFGQFLAQQFGQGLPGSICIYSDEVTPGNNLRPDKGRQFLAVYWALAPMPDWFRSRCGYWQTLMYVPCSTLKAIVGGLSALYVKVLETFWGPSGLNLQRLGIRIPVGDSLVHLHFGFGFFLSDEKAEKEALGVKGASGTKMCVSCANCVKCAKERIPAGSCFVHYTCSDMSQFIPQTERSLQAVLAELHEAKATMSREQFHLAEQAVGINYDGACLLYSHMRALARVPHSRYPDWFHNLLASGGIFQYQLNQLILALRTHGIEPECIDAFPVVFPRAYTRLKTSFFSDRYVRNEKAHMRAFGSEMLTAVVKMAFFMDLVAAPVGQLPRHCVHIRQAKNIIDMLLSGDVVLGRLATLDKLLKEHHDMFLSLHGQCAKPKLHFNRHLPEAMRNHGLNVSCLPPERKHKDAKRRATYLFRGFTGTLLHHEVAQMVNALSRPRLFEKQRLQEPVRPWLDAGADLHLQLSAFCALMPGPLAWSRSAVCGVVTLHQRDLVLWQDEHGATECVGRASIFLRDGGGAHYALVDEFPGAGDVWDIRRARPCVVRLGQVVGALPYVVLDDGQARVLKPF